MLAVISHTFSLHNIMVPYSCRLYIWIHCQGKHFNNHVTKSKYTVCLPSLVIKIQVYETHDGFNLAEKSPLQNIWKDHDSQSLSPEISLPVLVSLASKMGS